MSPAQLVYFDLDIIYHIVLQFAGLWIGSGFPILLAEHESSLNGRTLKGFISNDKVN